MGHAVHTVTLDSPGASVDPRLSSEKVFFLGPSRLKFRFSRHLKPWLETNGRLYDVIVVHGLWQYHGYSVRRAANAIGIPYVVFVHGMLDPWFKIRYPVKHLKKWLYWLWGEYRVLRDARFALFTTAEEMYAARQSFCLYKVREKVVSFGILSRKIPPSIAANIFKDRFPKLRDKRILLYLSRIHPKKGCDLLIRSFASVATTDERLHLVIAGPDEIGWGRKLSAEANLLGVGERVTFTGMLNGELKWGAYDSAEVFVLPSHQENFGVVVAEALASGVPILTTYKVNIWQEIRWSNAGLVASDTQAGIDQLLKGWLELPDTDKGRMRDSALECFWNHFHIQQATIRLMDALQQAQEKPRGDFTYISNCRGTRVRETRRHP